MVVGLYELVVHEFPFFHCARRQEGLEMAGLPIEVNRLRNQWNPQADVSYIAAMNKHHQNFLAWEIITIRPIDRWLRYGTVTSGRLAPPLFAVGGHVDRPLCRPATTHRRFFWLSSWSCLRLVFLFCINDPNILLVYISSYV